MEDIAAWMAVNEEGVFGTRVWKIFGEGPSSEASNPLHIQGLNEGKHEPYTSEDIRFVTKGNTLYAHVLAWPEDGKVAIKSLASDSPLYKHQIKKVELIGSNKTVPYKQTKDGLIVELPEKIKTSAISFLLKISN